MSDRFVCRSCMRALRQAHRASSSYSLARVNTQHSIPRAATHSPAPVTRYLSSKSGHRAPVPQRRSLQATEDAVQEVLDAPAVPTEEQVSATLKAIEAAALRLFNKQHPDAPRREGDGSPTSSILALRAQADLQRTSSKASEQATGEAEALSYLAYRFVKHPRVFLSPVAIEQYVNIQTLTSQLDSIPEIFNLYATKPQPQTSKPTSSQDVSYETPKPDAASSSIPVAAANLALDAAVQSRNLPVALSIIETSFERPAFRWNKFVRKGLPPVIGAGLTPIAAWTMASSMAEIQTGLPQETFTQIAFAGMATYAAAVGTIGYVALTSANDQMRRVTWAIGTPLRERWVREEERAAADRVACAWGFKETWRWGEEEGEKWEELKEWIGIRGMVLDKVGLMEGME